MNFLVHNMCRLPGADGTWMIVEGRHGHVSAEPGAAGREAGHESMTERGAWQRIVTRGGHVAGVALADGSEIGAQRGDQRTPIRSARARSSGRDGFRRTSTRGSTASRDGHDAQGQPRAGPAAARSRACRRTAGSSDATIHLLPTGAGRASARFGDAFERVQAGELRRVPDDRVVYPHERRPVAARRRGHHSAALFVQWVPTSSRRDDLGRGGVALRGATCSRSATASRRA